MGALIAGTFSIASVALIVYFVVKFTVEIYGDNKKHHIHH